MRLSLFGWKKALGALGYRVNWNSVEKRKSKKVHTDQYGPLEPRRMLASDIYVSTTADLTNPNDGLISLREAIDLAEQQPGTDTIRFADELFATTANPIAEIEVATTVVVDSDVNIVGPGNGLVKISSDDGLNRIFNINANVNARLEGLEISDGSATTGGLIYSYGDLTIVDSYLHHGTATSSNGGAIYSRSGTVTIEGSTFEANTSQSTGSSLITHADVEFVSISNSTFTNDFANTNGGSIYLRTVNQSQVINSTVANNASGGIRVPGGNGGARIDNTIVSNPGAQDLWGPFDPASSNNLIRSNSPGGSGISASLNQLGTSAAPIDARLGTLQDNGGPTKTIGLLQDSPAINAGNDNVPQLELDTTDQRGLNRSYGQIDIGAVESEWSDFTVSTTTDVSDGNYSIGNLSLREAITLAQNETGHNTIGFDPTVFTASTAINLNQFLNLNSDITLNGLGAGVVVLDAGANDRVFVVQPDVEVDLVGLELRNGSHVTGGLIYSEGDLTINDSYLHGGVATLNSAGGVFVRRGSLTVENSTFENNKALTVGTAITTNADANFVSIVDSTFSGNILDSGAANTSGSTIYLRTVNQSRIVGSTIANNNSGGVRVPASFDVRVDNSIISNTLDGGTATKKDVWGPFNSSSRNNVVGDTTNSSGLLASLNQLGTTANTLDPGLQPLSDNGGPTKTHRLNDNSIAIDTGDNSIALVHSETLDQRGRTRFFGQVDVGAYEWQDVVTLPGKVRDFNATGTTNGHPDFQRASSGRVYGLVLDELDVDGLPVFNPDNTSGAIESAQSFTSWYRDTPGLNLTDTLALDYSETSPGSGEYQFSSDAFFPIDGQLLGNQGNSHNYHFTYHVSSSFTFNGDEFFEFEGDDDVWVFINNRLAVDIGGIHGKELGNISLDEANAYKLGLEKGNTYSFDLFFAERRLTQSNFKATTSLELINPAASQIQLVEEDRLYTSTQEFAHANTTEFVIPANADAIRIGVSDLFFDASSGNPARINDAFEFAVLDSAGNSVIPTLGAFTDAVLNVTQGSAPVWATGVELLDSSGNLLTNPSSFTDGFVQVDVSQLQAGSTVQLVARLLNNDADNTSSVGVAFDVGDPAQGLFALLGTAFSNLPTVAQTVYSNPIFEALEDVTSTFDISYGTTHSTESKSVTFGINLEKTGQLGVRNQLLLAFKDLRDEDQQPTNAVLTNADGFLPFDIQGVPRGTPYLDLTFLFDKNDEGHFLDTASITNLVLEFEQLENSRFEFEPVLLGELNKAPVFTSDPTSTNQGQAYPILLPSGGTALEIVAGTELTYAPTTFDIDGDEVTVSIVGAPSGLSLNSGSIQWTPSTSDIGIHEVRLRATDSLQLFDSSNDQTILIRVVDNIPNRAPSFKNTPDVVAFAGVAYTFDSQPFDPDGDAPLQINNVDVASYLDDQGTTQYLAAVDFQVDSNGTIQWTPTEDLIGKQVNVSLEVSDLYSPNPGIGYLDYQIIVRQDPRNNDPVIVSTPSTGFDHAEPIAPTSATNVTPSLIELNLAEGQTNNPAVNVSLLDSLDADNLDIVFLVDRSGSMIPQGSTAPLEWLEDMIVADSGNGYGYDGIDVELGQNGFDRQYGLVTFTTGATKQVVGSGDFGTASDLATAISNISNNGGDDEDGYEAMSVALNNFTFRPNAQVVFVLVSDAERFPGSSHDYQSILSDLQRGTQEDVILTSIVAAGFEGAELEETSALPITADMTEVYGNWTEDDSWAVGGASIEDGVAVVVEDLPLQEQFFGEEITERVRTRAKSLTGTDFYASIVFGYGGPGSFYYAMVESGSDQLIIGARTGEGPSDYTELASMTLSQPIDADSIVDLELSFKSKLAFGQTSNTVNFVVGANVLTHTFNGALNAQSGLMSLGNTEFDFLDHDSKYERSNPAYSTDYSTRFYSDFVDAGEELGVKGYTAYTALPNNGFATSVPGKATWGIRSTEADYVQLAMATGGSAWDIRIASDENDSPDRIGSFTSAFASSLRDSVLDRVGADIQLTDADIVFDWNRTTSGVNDFEVTFTGDGRSRNTFLQFISRADGTELGRIPVAINAGYSYDLSAIDPDGDAPLLFSFTEGSDNHGAQIIGDRLIWNPPKPADPAVPESYDFNVTVRDGRGGFDVQEWTVVVGEDYANNQNQTPQIQVSTPPDATEQFAWQYQVSATDADGDTLRYYLVDDPQTGIPSPSSMKIDRNTGLVTWVPKVGDAGPASFWVLVSDGRTNGEATAQFDMTVNELPIQNNPPTFTTTAPTSAATEILYSYQANAVDIDGDQVSYSLISKPEGMGIDAQTGQIVWTPKVNQLGNSYVVVKATDSRGAYSIQDFYVITTLSNQAPEVTGGPAFATANAGQTSQFDFQFVDIDSPDLTFELVSGPGSGTFTPGSVQGTTPGTSVASTLSFTPDPGTVGDHNLIIKVTDGEGASTTHVVNLYVHNGIPLPPIVAINPRTEIAAGATFEAQVYGFDPNGETLEYYLVDQNNNLVDTLSATSGTSGIGQIPEGMAIDRDTGVVSWNPNESHITQDGQLPFTYSVAVIAGADTTYLGYEVELRVVSDMTNRPPAITSDPSSNFATPEKPFVYRATADDPDNDVVRWYLVDGPDTAQIDESTGLFLWAPAESEFGEAQTATIRAEDTHGGFTTQTFDLNFRFGNTPPRITSNPSGSIFEGDDWTYLMTAVDPDSDSPLVFSIVSVEGLAGGPYSQNDFTINTVGETSAELYWATPAIGTVKITIQVSDPAGGFGTQVLTLPVNSVGLNNDTPPIITSDPILAVSDGDTYRYQVTSVDPDGPVTYSIIAPTAPDLEGAINSSTGLILWDTTTSGVTPGSYEVTVVAVENGVKAFQSFLLNVSDPSTNQAPIIVPESGLKVTSGGSLDYRVMARDLDNDYPLEYRLVDANGDEFKELNGFAIDNTGRVTWQPVGTTASFTVRVRDTLGALDEETFNIDVVQDEAPFAALTVDTTTPISGNMVNFRLEVRDDLGIRYRYVKLVNSALFGSEGKLLNVGVGGRARFEVPDSWNSNESFDVVGIAEDTGGNVTTTDPITVNVTPRNVDAPDVVIHTPFEDELIGETVDLKVTVVDANNDLVSYVVELKDLTGTVVAQLASHSDGGNIIPNITAPTSVGSFDPSVYPNGEYIIVLTATDAANNTSVTDVAVTLDGRPELGDMEVAFVDLEVPVRGLPITITRTYDSGDSETVGDFGHGWDLEITGIDIEISYPDGVLYGDGYPVFEDNVRVEFTLPDGSVEGFTFYGEKAGFLSAFYYPKFQPDASNRNSELTVTSTLLNKSGNGRSYSAVDGGPGGGDYYNPANKDFATAYKLTLRNGTSMFFNPRTGELSKLETRTGEILRFSDFGIESSAGRNVDFVRDAQGRITKIIDPSGNALEYTYDANGDLVSFKDRELAVTTFSYDPNNPHYLANILDPLGRNAVTTYYEISTGKIDYIVDADGRTLDYRWGETDSVVQTGQTNAVEVFETVEELDGDQAIKIVTHADRNGNPLRIETSLIETLSGNENVIGETSIVLRSYNNRQQVTSETTVVGLEDGAGNSETDDLTTTYDYDASTGDLLRTIDPRKAANPGMYQDAIVYNDFGQPTIVKDDFGNVTVNGYDQYGQLTSTTSANFSAKFKYDSDGNLTQVIDAANDTLLTTNNYNQFGDLIYTQDTNGSVSTFAYDLDGNQVESRRFVFVDHDFDPTTAEVEYEFKTVTEYDLEGLVVGTTQYKTNLGTQVTEMLSTNDMDDKNALGQDQTTTSSSILSGAEDPVTTYTYDKRGQTIQTVREGYDSSGATTNYVSLTVYDAKGRAEYSTTEFKSGTNVADIDGTRSYYDAEGRVIRTDQLRGLDIQFTGTGDNQTAYVNSAGILISYSTTEYGNDGRVKSSTSYHRDGGPGLTTNYFYNQFGETTRTETEGWDSAGTGKVTWISQTVYDDFGRAFFSVDSHLAGEVVYATETIFDDTGRSIGSIRYEGANVNFDPVTGITSIVSKGTVLTSTSTVFDSQGRVSRSIAADGQIAEYEYDSRGRRVATIGSAVLVGGTIQRHRTETVYDSRGRVRQERSNIIHDDSGSGQHDDSNAQTTTFDYDENGNVVRTTWTDGSYAQVRFDELGRKVAESQQVASSVDLIWSDTELSFVDAANGNAIVPTRMMTYDTQGRLATVSLPAVSDPLNAGQSTRPTYQYGYDSRGQQTSIIDPYGNETLLTYNDLGQQTARTLPLGAGADGIHGNGDDVPFSESYEYDSRGRQFLHESFEGVVMESVYDSDNGRMVETRYYQSRADYDNSVIAERREYSYDEQGRQFKTYYFIGNSATPDRTEIMTYNDRGQLEVAIGEVGSIFYKYDSLGRQVEVLSTTATLDPTALNFDLGTVDFENVTAYGYDELGRLKTVSAIEQNNVMVDVDSILGGDQADVTTYFYDLIGNLDKTLFGNGIGHEYIYDELNRLDQLNHFVDDDGDGLMDKGEQRAVFDYTVRADGKRTGVVEKFWEDAGGELNFADHQNTFTWNYDDVGRLIREALDSKDDTLDYTDAFVWDLTGNRTSTTRDWADDAANEDYTTTYSYDVNDRLTSETKDYVDAGVDDETITYGYDFTQQTSKSTVVAGKTTVSQAFEYDLQGRMALVKTSTYAADGVTLTKYTEVSYEYDASGNRVASEIGEATDGTTNITSRTRTEYLTDKRNHTGYSQVLQETEFDTNGVAIKKTVYTVGHDQISQTVFSRVDTDGDGTLESTDGWDGGEVHYFGTDGHGSVRVLYDLAAAVVQDASNVAQIFHFDAHGNLLNFAGGSPLTSYLYSGEAFDHNIGQQYLRARWYDPVSGRFNRLDPFFGNLSDPQSLHKYLYVHGDPVNGVDPSGRSQLSASLQSMAIRANNSLTNTSIFVYSYGFSLAQAFPITTQLLILGFQAYSVYTLLTDDAAKDVFLGTLGTNPTVALAALADDLSNAILSGKNLGMHLYRGSATRFRALSEYTALARNNLLTNRGLGLNSAARKKFKPNGSAVVATGEFTPTVGRRPSPKVAFSGQKNADGYVDFIPTNQSRLNAIEVDGYLRDVDADFKILAAFDAELPKDAEGVLRVFIDRKEVCPSCHEAFRQFRELRPKIEIQYVDPEGFTAYFNSN